MLRSFLLTTALVGVAGAAAAQDVHMGGAYVATDGIVTLGEPISASSLPRSGIPVHHIDAMSHGGTMPHGGTIHGGSYEVLGGQYEVVGPQEIVQPIAAPALLPAPATTQTVTMTPGTPQSFTMPHGQNATYNIVVPAATAPAVTYAPTAPVYAAPAPAAVGWKARGVYVGARAGVVSQRDTDFDIRDLETGKIGTIESSYDDPGYTGSLVVGYGARSKAGWGYRVELEGGYQSAEVDRHTIGKTKVSSRESVGDVNVTYGFVNAYGDIALTDRIALTAGGGVGAGHVSFDKFGTRSTGTALDDSDTAFGYHLDAGVAYQLTDKVALEALYRYQSFMDVEVRTENGNRDKIDLDNHSILVGARVGL